MFKFKGFCESFKTPALLEQALTHSSYLHENSNVTQSYERLEFLGDSILGLLCAELLSERCPRLNEGQLSRLKSIFVSEPSLAARARTLGMGTLLRLGKGEVMNGGVNRESILADTIESVLAAAYLDQGLEFARNYLLEFVFPEWKMNETEWESLVRQQLQKDSKSQLQEFFQQSGWGLPKYVCLNNEEAGSTGPFEMAIFVGNIELIRGMSPSKKEGTLKIAHSLLAMGIPKLVALLRTKGLSNKAETHDLGPGVTH